MKTPAYALLGAVLLMGLFPGCSEKTEPKPFTYSRLLTGETNKTWRMTGIRYFENGTSEPINFPCAFDDLYIFYNDDLKTFEYRGGADKCDPEDPNALQDSWSLVNATGSLSFSIPFLLGEATYPFIIRNLTENTLAVEVFFEGGDAGYRFIFTAQKEG